jgi:lysozyme
MRDTFEFIKDEEGFRKKPYFDTENVATFGIGFTYITEDEADDILKKRLEDIDDLFEDRFFWYNWLNHTRKTVVISMVYQLGLGGFEKFKKMIIALEDEEYEEAAKQMLDSLWAIQTPERAERQANMMSEG